MYNKPEFEIIELSEEDVILTSNTGGLIDGGEGSLEDLEDNFFG